MYWDACNKWLHFGRGGRWVLMLGDWLCWLDWGKPTFMAWTLFRVAWDNGSWWAFDLDNALILDGKKHGDLEAYVEFVVLGVGLRRWYKRRVVFDERRFRDSMATKGGQE